MSGDQGADSRAARLPSGVRGLDTVLRGGFLVGGTYMITGSPGAGKTILGNQVAFHHVAGGGSAMYVTLLAESHGQMLDRLASMSFFSPEAVGSRVQYVSGYDALEKGGLDALLELLRSQVRNHQASVLLLDGMLTLHRLADSALGLRRFLHELQTLGGLLGCTTFLLTGAGTSDDNYVERTMVDGILLLRMERSGMRSIRHLEVEKFRGSDALLGQHIFRIDVDGITIHPRTESVLVGRGPRGTTARVTLGVPNLDEMANGGVAQGTTTLVAGHTGAGKTLLGLQFLAGGARLGERGLYFGFHESPERLLDDADAVGSDLRAHIDAGLVELHWISPIERIGDEIVEVLLSRLVATGAVRLFLDGTDGLARAVHETGRLYGFFSAVTNELRRRGVTTLFSVETRFGINDGALPMPELSAIAENVIILRSIQVRSQQRRLLTIMKMRGVHFESATRELTVSAGGVVVMPDSNSAEFLLSGAVPPVDTAPVGGARGRRRRPPKRPR